jgi:hypothetical protein
MSVDTRVALDLDDLPMDIFELTDQGLVVESLSTGHGMTRVDASPCSLCSACSCCCSS